jgi:curved DNA-binding protein CbpA
VRGTGVAAVVTAGAVTGGNAAAERNPALIAGITALIKERLHILDRGADHFVLLGVNEQTPPDQIRTAYFALARQLHPDRLTSAGIVDLKRDAQRLFAQINTAFAVLTNPEKRHQYVQILRQGGEAVVRAKQAEAEALTARVLAAEDAFHRGEMALRRSQFEAAIADFTEAITANPEEGDYHASLAWAMFCGANDKSSVEKNTRIVFEKSVKLSPRSVTALLYWGRMERMLGNTSAAREKFEAILKKEPSHSEASSELRVLDSRGDRIDEKTDKPKGLFGLFKK